MQNGAAGMYGVVLAGGQSRRMAGHNKARQLLGGKSLLAHAVGRLSTQAKYVAINANTDLAACQAFGIPVLGDPVPGHQGPLAGILAAMVWARANGAANVVTVAVDTPFFPGSLVRSLVAAATDERPAIAQSGGRSHPVFGCWPVSLCDPLQSDIQNGTRKVGAWAAGCGAAKVDFPAKPGRDPFFNINTPQDLQHAQSLLKA